MYSALGRQRLRKQSDPNLKIVVAGCVAQQEGETLLRRVPEVDLVMGPQHANRLQELLEQVEFLSLAFTLTFWDFSLFSMLPVSKFCCDVLA